MEESKLGIQTAGSRRQTSGQTAAVMPGHPSQTRQTCGGFQSQSQSFLFSIGIKFTPQNSSIFLGHDGKKFTKPWKQKEVNAHNLYVWNNHRVYDLRNETETQRCLWTAPLNSLKTNDRISRTDFKISRELSKYRGPVTLGCNPSGSLVLSLARQAWRSLFVSTKLVVIVACV